MTEEPSDLIGLMDVDSPVFEAASLTDDIKYIVDGIEYSSYTSALKAGEISGVRHDIKPFPHAVHILNNRLKGIQRRFKKPLRVFVSNKNSNYRYGVSADYKGNRPPGRPYWISELQDWLVEAWGAEVSPPYMETDDMVSEAQDGDRTCIISKDKDLDTVPGWHYNYSKPEEGFYYVTEQEAFHFFCVQMLAGDNADNIGGVPSCNDDLIRKYGLHPAAKTGCGMGTAKKIMEGAETYDEMIDRVIDTYRAVFKDPREAFMRMTKTALLLRMGRRLYERG